MATLAHDNIFFFHRRRRMSFVAMPNNGDSVSFAFFPLFNLSIPSIYIVLRFVIAVALTLNLPPAHAVSHFSSVVLPLIFAIY